MDAKILLVDDEPMVTDVMERYLRREGFQVLLAADGEAAVATAQECAPDLILLDLMLPKIDGLTAFRQIRSHSSVPVIILTAKGEETDRIVGLETGADDYIIKPFDARELQVRVKNLIEQRRKLRERFAREITVQPKDITITSMDEQFLQKAMDVVEQNLSDPEFSTERFAQRVAMSRMQLHRKLRALTDHSAHEFVRTYRLKRAAQLLRHQASTVTEICYDVGFNSLSHFSKAFREQFEQSPSEFADTHSGEES